MGNIASVAKHLPEESLEELRSRLTVIGMTVGMTGSQLDVEEFPSLMDDQVQREAKEPVYGGVASSR